MDLHKKKKLNIFFLFRIIGFRKQIANDIMIKLYILFYFLKNM